MALSYSSSIIVGSLTYSPSIVPQATVTQTEEPLIQIVPDTTTPAPTSTPVTPELATDQSQVSLVDLTNDGILWFAELPPGTVTPYAVLYLSSGIVVAGKTTAYTVFRATYEISIIADTKDQAVVRAAIARKRFNKKTLQDDTYSTVQTQTGSVYDQIAPGLGLNGADAWMASFSLEVLYRRF